MSISQSTHLNSKGNSTDLYHELTAEAIIRMTILFWVDHPNWNHVKPENFESEYERARSEEIDKGKFTLNQINNKIAAIRQKYGIKNENLDSWRSTFNPRRCFLCAKTQGPCSLPETQTFKDHLREAHADLYSPTPDSLLAYDKLYQNESEALGYCLAKNLEFDKTFEKHCTLVAAGQTGTDAQGNTAILKRHLKDREWADKDHFHCHHCRRVFVTNRAAMQKHLEDHFEDNYMKIGVIKNDGPTFGKCRPEYHEIKAGKHVEWRCGTGARYLEFRKPTNTELSDKGEILCRCCDGFPRKWRGAKPLQKALSINAMRSHESECFKAE